MKNYLRKKDYKRYLRAKGNPIENIIYLKRACYDIEHNAILRNPFQKYSLSNGIYNIKVQIPINEINLKTNLQKNLQENNIKRPIMRNNDIVKNITRILRFNYNFQAIQSDIYKKEDYSLILNGKEFLKKLVSPNTKIKLLKEINTNFSISENLECYRFKKLVTSMNYEDAFLSDLKNNKIFKNIIIKINITEGFFSNRINKKMRDRQLHEQLFTNL